jgi:sulfur transfer protein SufE
MTGKKTEREREREKSDKEPGQECNSHIYLFIKEEQEEWRTS